MKIPSIQEAIVLLQDIFKSKIAIPPAKSSLPVVIYGAGELGKLAQDYCKHVGIDVKCVVDRSVKVHTDSSCVYPIEYLSTVPSLPVLIATASEPFNSIKNSLVSFGCSNVLSFYDYAQNYKYRHPLNNGWYAHPISAGDKRGMESVMLGLADDISVAAYLQSIAWRSLREDWTFDGVDVTNTNRYFIPEVTSVLNDKETFLDVGSYDGRVLKQLIDITGGIKSALLIEPDKYNLSKMPVSTMDNVSVKRLALSDFSGKILFADGLDYASRISDIGNLSVETLSMDDLRIAPTFIKIHAEGGELPILIGGRHTLINCRPIIAVTLYHNRDGLWKIPMYLMTLLNDYNFYFRMHSWMGTGTVLYAIPTTRGEIRG